MSTIVRIVINNIVMIVLGRNLIVINVKIVYASDAALPVRDVMENIARIVVKNIHVIPATRRSVKNVYSSVPIVIGEIVMIVQGIKFHVIDVEIVYVSNVDLVVRDVIITIVIIVRQIELNVTIVEIVCVSDVSRVVRTAIENIVDIVLGNMNVINAIKKSVINVYLVVRDVIMIIANRVFQKLHVEHVLNRIVPHVCIHVMSGIVKEIVVELVLMPTHAYVKVVRVRSVNRV